MRPMTEAVIEMALAQLAEWSALGLRQPVAANLSAESSYDKDFVAGLLEYGENHEVALDLMQLEITESALVERPEAAARTLQSLRDAGCRIYIDDFGTGYSSLSYLVKLPVHAIEDRSFVLEMTRSESALAVVASVISMAHALGIEVVAEGVETESDLRRLQKPSRRAPAPPPPRDCAPRASRGRARRRPPG
jgi:EAL domain-containing protein (putative c-di-GMP-specific phosphodiesterase class I)